MSLGTTRVNETAPVKEEPMKEEIPKPQLSSHVGDALFLDKVTSEAQKPVEKSVESFGSEDFMSESAGLKQLEADEVEFEESNKFNINVADLQNQNDSAVSEHQDSNMSSYFRRSNQSFGLGPSASPKKDPEADLTVPSILQSTAAPEEATFEVPKEATYRRDTISTIKSMSPSLFETTANWDKVHQQLREEDQSALSASYREKYEVIESFEADDNISSLSMQRSERLMIPSIFLCSIKSGQSACQLIPQRSLARRLKVAPRLNVLTRMLRALKCVWPPIKANTSSSQFKLMKSQVSIIRLP